MLYVKTVPYLWDTGSQSKIVRPLGAPQQSWHSQCFSVLSIRLRALSEEGGGQMKSKSVIETSAVPLWSAWEKWNPLLCQFFVCVCV